MGGQQGSQSGRTKTVLLRVRRGRTERPERVVRTDRFLIGSGERCDLRLEAGVPPLHSLIYRDDDGLHIEAVVSSPPLLVNGQIRASAALQDGDLIEIGPFQFEVCVVDRPPARAAASPVPRPEAGPANPDERPIHELSAAELVERLKRESEEVSAVEAGKRRGADALMHEIARRAAIASRTIPQALAAIEATRSVAERARKAARSETVYADVTGLAADLERLGKRLLEYERQLEERAARLAEREAQFAEAAAALTASQEKLTQYLDRLIELLQQRQGQGEPSPSVSQLRKAV